MTIVKILAICALALAPCAAMYARCGWKAQKTLPFSLCAQSLILYIFGLFLPFSCCAAILCAICLCCAGYFLLRSGGWRRMLGFLNAPVFLFVLGAPLLYYVCCDRMYLSYDEYSHWGLIIKVISMYDALPRAGEGASLMLFNYPPAGAMWPALCTTALSYREGIAYFGYTLLLWGLTLGLVPEKGGAVFHTLCGAALFLCLMVLFPFTILRLFSEPLIALIFVLLIVYARDGEKTRMQWLRTLTLCAFLALTKNSAPIFVALYLIVRVCLRPKKKECLCCVGLAAFGAAAYFSYLIYCGVQGIAPAFDSYVTQNLRAIMDGTLDARHASAPGRFIAHFFTAKFPQSGVYSCYALGVSPAVLYGALLALCAAHAALSKARRETLRMWGGVWGGTLIYTVFIMLSYVFIFTANEAGRLSEMDRYLSLPALIIGLLLCALSLRGASRMGAKARGAIGCALCVLQLPICHPTLIFETMVTRSNVVNTVWGRTEPNAIASLLRENVDLSGKQKVRVIGTVDYMALRYEVLTEVDWGHPADNWNEADFALTAQGVAEEIASGGYAYVVTGRFENDSPARTLDARYAALFEGGEAEMEPFALYKVEKTEETAFGVKLVHMATAVFE